MKKWVSWMVLGLLVLSLAAVAGCKKGGSPEDIANLRKTLTSYEMSVTNNGQQVTMLYKFKDGQPVRMKIQTPGGGWMLSMLDKKENYTFIPAMNAVMKMPVTGTAEAAPAEAKKLTEGMEATAKNLGAEAVDGVDCWIFETSSGKAWVDKQYGLLRKAQVGGQETVIKYNRINAVPDSDFELPAGVQVIDQNAMMSGMGNMPDLSGLASGTAMPAMENLPSETPEGTESKTNE